MKPNLITITDPGCSTAEAYRRLRVNLLAMGRQASLRSLLVVAAAADPDKALTIANLAVTFARVGKRVILVDCDLRSPAQHSIFGLGNDRGVTTALAAPGTTLPLQNTTVAGLRVLTSGPATDVPSDLIASAAMTHLIASLQEQADVVLFDIPPVVAATDAAELAVQVDGTLLTVRAGHTKREEAQRAKELLERVGARLVGAALVNVPGA